MTILLPPTVRSRQPQEALATDFDALRELADQLNGQPVPDVRMTEQQFIDWQPKGIRAEWENGRVILMTAANGEHQDLNGWLFRILSDFADHHDLGLVRMPFSVRLPSQKRRREPDLIFVAKRRQAIVEPQQVNGPADLVIEIVSPDSSVRDWRTKYNEYEQAGVAEYWVVDPLLQRFDLYVRKSKKYQQQPVDESGRVHSKVLRGLYLKPAWLWRKPLPKLASISKELGLRPQ